MRLPVQPLLLGHAVPTVFALSRFVAGLGLGGVVPTAIARTVENAHPGTGW